MGMSHEQEAGAQESSLEPGRPSSIDARVDPPRSARDEADLLFGPIFQNPLGFD